MIMEREESFNILIPLTPRDSQGNREEGDIKMEVSQIKLQLLAMDFKDVLIDNLSLFFEIQSVEDAIHLMSKEKGVWQHNFIEDQGDLCLICQEEADHIDYKIKSNAINDDNTFSLLEENQISARVSYDALLEKINQRKSILSQEDNEEDIISRPSIGDHSCQLCFEAIPQDRINDIFIECHHYFCHDCWLEYFSVKITDGEVKDIKCMLNGCGMVLPSKFIKSQIKEVDQLMLKYDKFSRKIIVANNPNMKLCPEPNCEGYGEKVDSKFIQCSEGHKFCFNCLKKWHGNKKCEDLIDKDFEKYKKTTRMKQCPKCSYYTEKNEGCNHMTCRSCGTDWCWLCCQLCDPYNHYNDGSCAGLQMVQVGCLQNQTVFFFYKIGKFLLTWVVYWIIFFPFYCYGSFIDQYDGIINNTYGCCAPFLVTVFMVFIPLFYMVWFFMYFQVLISLIIFIPALFYWPWLDIALEYMTLFTNVERFF